MLDKKFKEKAKNNLSKVSVFRKIIPEEEIKKSVVKKFKEFEDKYDELVEAKIAELTPKYQETLTAEQIEKLAKSPVHIPLADSIFFYEGKAFLIIETPEVIMKTVKDEETGEEDEVPTNVPVQSKPDANGTIKNPDFRIWRNCKFKLGSITIMGNVDDFDEIAYSKTNAWVQGRISPQYIPKGKTYEDAYTSFEDLLKNEHNEIKEKILDGSWLFVEGDNYQASYSLTLYQTMDVWE